MIPQQLWIEHEYLAHTVCCFPHNCQLFHNDRYTEAQGRCTFKYNMYWTKVWTSISKSKIQIHILGNCVTKIQPWVHGCTWLTSHPLYLYWLVILRKEITHNWCFHDNRPDVFTAKLTFVKSCAKSHAKSHISQEVWSGSSFVGFVPKREFSILLQMICKPMLLESKWAVLIHLH